MPRLIGKKRSSLPSLTVFFLIGALVGGALVSEYAGLIDYVPEVGREKAATRLTQKTDL